MRAIVSGRRCLSSIRSPLRFARKGPERWLRVDRQLGRDEHQAWRLGRQNSWQDGSRLCHRSRGSNDNIGFYQAQRDNPRTAGFDLRSEEHTSELQSLMRISYAVFCLKKKIINQHKAKKYKHIK